MIPCSLIYIFTSLFRPHNRVEVRFMAEDTPSGFAAYLAHNLAKATSGQRPRDNLAKATSETPDLDDHYSKWIGSQGGLDDGDFDNGGKQQYLPQHYGGNSWSGSSRTGRLAENGRIKNMLGQNMQEKSWTPQYATTQMQLGCNNTNSRSQRGVNNRTSMTCQNVPRLAEASSSMQNMAMAQHFGNADRINRGNSLNSMNHGNAAPLAAFGHRPDMQQQHRFGHTATTPEWSSQSMIIKNQITPQQSGAPVQDMSVQKRFSNTATHKGTSRSNDKTQQQGGAQERITYSRLHLQHATTQKQFGCHTTLSCNERDSKKSISMPCQNMPHQSGATAFGSVQDMVLPQCNVGAAPLRWIPLGSNRNRNMPSQSVVRHTVIMFKFPNTKDNLP